MPDSGFALQVGPNPFLRHDPSVHPCIGRAAIPIARAKLHGEAAHAADRALLRMGLKHLGLAAASMALHGAPHYVALGVEAATATGDAYDSKPKLRELHKAVVAALRGLMNVKFLDPSKQGPLKVELVKQLLVAPEAAPGKGAGNPEETAGPPPAG